MPEPIVLAGADEHDLTKLAEYHAIGGYQGVPKARAMTPEALIDELQAATLRGRGGAGFPMGRKASLIEAAGRFTLMVERVMPTVRYVSVEGPVTRTVPGTDALLREIAERWSTERHSYFKLCADDDHRYILRYEADEQVWELVMRENPPSAPAFE